MHADRRPFLAARGRITAAARDFFEARGFVEVETAVLQVSPGNEAHLHAFATQLQAPDGTWSMTVGWEKKPLRSGARPPERAAVSGMR